MRTSLQKGKTMIDFQDVSFTYAEGSREQGVQHISLNIPRGQVVILCGESGCGKTTIARLVNGLIPQYYEGELSGQILVDSLPVSRQPLYATTPKVGSVFQNPRSQFFTVDTNSELAFACENMGVPKEAILQRIAHTVEEFKLQPLMGRSIFNLSGGEKQKIACASVSTLGPDVMVLDEPSSNLDLASIRGLSEIIARWKAEGKTVLIAEHRLYYVMPLADRVLYMRNGKLDRDMTIQEFRALSASEVSAMGLRSLHPTKFDAMQEPPHAAEAWQLSDFYFSYQKQQALRIPELTVPKGAVIGIIGNNGAGKTTFSRCLCGLQRRFSGRCNGMKRKELLQHCYMVMQDVNHQLFTESVSDEVLLSLKTKDEAEGQQETDQILRALHLLEVKDRHPLSLSGGQKQRVAIASAIASDKDLLVFDEPTSGLDYRHMLEVSDCLKQLSHMGKTLFIVTHDPELAAHCCNYFVFLEKGCVKWSGCYTDIQDKLSMFFSTEVQPTP